MSSNSCKLQQYLPLAVLKLKAASPARPVSPPCCNSTYRLRYWNWRRNSRVINSSERCCNSTYRLRYWNQTKAHWFTNASQYRRLQQYLPLAVLKPWIKASEKRSTTASMLQQYLPLAVLKLFTSFVYIVTVHWVATVLTACGIETSSIILATISSFLVATVLTACGIETGRFVSSRLNPYFFLCCNSTYRLRYWNKVNSTKR